MIPPMGKQGFDSIESAVADAKTVTTMPFAVLERTGVFGWCLPIEYAKRIALSNVLRFHGEFES